MKIYIVQCNEKVSSLGYSTVQEALAFVNERVINGLSNGYDIDEYSSNKWCAKLVRKSDDKKLEYKILEIQIDD